MALTVAQIREDYSAQAPAWVQEQIDHLRVVHESAAPVALGWKLAVNPRASLETLSRPTLQALAKKHGVKGGPRSCDIIDKLLDQLGVGGDERTRGGGPNTTGQLVELKKLSECTCRAAKDVV